MSDTNWTSTAPDYFNQGDQAWQLTAATLVGLQSIPGLMIMYAGLVKKKWALNSAFMVMRIDRPCGCLQTNANLVLLRVRYDALGLGAFRISHGLRCMAPRFRPSRISR